MLSVENRILTANVGSVGLQGQDLGLLRTTVLCLRTMVRFCEHDGTTLEHDDTTVRPRAAYARTEESYRCALGRTVVHWIVPSCSIVRTFVIKGVEED